MVHIPSRLLIAALCLVFVRQANAALFLSAGDTLSFAFDNPASTAETFAFDIRVRLIFSSLDLQEEHDSYRLSVFEDVESSTPFDTSVYGGSPRVPNSGLDWRWTNASHVSPWRRDLDGMLRIEMLTGTLAMEAIDITIKGLDGSFYQETYVIPESTTTSLLIFGIGVTLLKRRSHLNCGAHGRTDICRFFRRMVEKLT